MLSFQDLVFVIGPWAGVDNRMEIHSPSFPALAWRSCPDVVGDEFPVRDRHAADDFDNAEIFLHSEFDFRGRQTG
jgi:hypothetical protein